MRTFLEVPKQPGLPSLDLWGAIRQEIWELASYHASQSGKNHATAKDVEEAAKKLGKGAIIEELTEEFPYRALECMKKSLSLLPKSINWAELDEFATNALETQLLKISDRVMGLLASQTQKPVGLPERKALKDKKI